MKQLAVFILLGLTMTMASRVTDNSIASSDLKRYKRFLIFPPSAPARVQLILGIGIPVDLEYESVTIGYVLKSEYYLPDNTSTILHFLHDPFDPLTHPLERRKRNVLSGANDDNHNKLIENSSNDTESSSISKDRYEKYDVEAVEVGTGSNSNEGESDDESQYSDDWNDGEEEEYSSADYRITKQNDFTTARWSLYKGIETMAERKGLAGRPCMLRTICESAHAPFTFSSGIVAELMHVVMTPSSSKDAIIDNSLNEYFRAEELGKSGAPCDKVFRECTTSVLDRFSGIYSSMENIMKMIG